ncbi:autotransporter assembly complex family protein [soil metagenome]
MGRLRFALVASSAALAALGASTCALADEPKAVITGDMSADLHAAIERAVGQSKTAAGSRLEARRRAREAAEDVIAVLDSEGYRDNAVTPDIGEGDKPQPLVSVVPGQRFTMAGARVTWIGAAPSQDVQTLGVKAIDLADGIPGRAADVLAAEGRVVSTVQKKGYADAAAVPREVIADFADHTLRPEFRIAAGDLVRLDGIDLRTTGRTNPRWVQQLAPWKEGDVYAPDDVAELERRLLDAGVYDSVTVALAPKDSMVDGKRPVIVSLADRARGTIELGAGYSTSEGLGMDGRWLRYNRLGRADTTTLLFRYAEIERRFEGEISLPHWRKAQTTLKVGAGVFQDETDAYDETGLNAHADLTRRYGKTSYRTLGVSLDVTRTDEMLPIPQTRDLITLTGLGALSWDKSNDPLDPKRGWRVEARLEPTSSFGDDTLFYLRGQVQGTAYFPFDDKGDTVAATRVKLGSVVGVSLADVPAARRLYAGGGGSVRGYAYQGVGPRLANGTPQGGVSLFEASGEIRRRITDKWGAVVFADVGAVGDQSAPSFSRVSTGVGAGVRYNLGFGPIRADIAIPVNRRAGDPAYQVYLSIGQSF